MRVRSRKGWTAEIADHVSVTEIEVESGETVSIEPGPGQRAVVLIVPNMEMVPT